jgi:hypothetical protein
MVIKDWPYEAGGMAVPCRRPIWRSGGTLAGKVSLTLPRLSNGSLDALDRLQANLANG